MRLRPRADGRPSAGAWLTLTDPAVASALAKAGFDWLCVDEQHGGPTPADTVRIAAAVAQEIPLMVRVAWNRPEHIGRALDSGATGVIVPMVQSSAHSTCPSRWACPWTTCWAQLVRTAGRDAVAAAARRDSVQ